VTSPRQAALGGKTITIYDDDVNQVNFNPATINVEMTTILVIIMVVMQDSMRILQHRGANAWGY
jgi:hypothetical protein